MKRITVLSILILFVALATASEPAATDALYLELEKNYTLHDDGRITFEYHHKVKLITHYAFNRQFGEDFIIYNPRFQKLDILKSVTTMADGKEIESPENAYNTVLPRAVANAPAYAHLREMVVTHTGLERGAIIDFAYRLQSDADWMPWLMEEETFTQRYPVERYTVTVQVPKDKTLLISNLNQAPEPGIRQEATHTIYTWELEEVPAWKSEPSQIDPVAAAPRILFSTCQSWQQLLQHMKLDSRECELSLSTIKAETSFKDMDTIKTYAKQVEDQIRSVPIDPQYVGYRLFEADSVLKHGHGYALERANLLCCLLRARDFSCSPVLISKSDRFCINVPAFSQFSHAGVLVENVSANPFIVVMDKKKKRPIQYEMAGHMVLRLDEQQKPLYKIPDPDPQSHFVRLYADLDEAGQAEFSADCRLEVGGKNHSGFALENETARKRFVQRFVSPFEIAEMHVDFLSPDSCAFDLKVTGKDIFDVQDPVRILQLPSFIDPAMHEVAVNLKRVTAIDMIPIHEVVHFNLSLSHVSAPDETHFHLSNPVGTFRFRIHKTDKGVRVQRTLAIDKTEIAPHSFADLRELLVNYYAPEFNYLYFTEE